MDTEHIKTVELDDTKTSQKKNDQINLWLVA